MTDSSVDPEETTPGSDEKATAPASKKRKGMTVLILVLLFLAGLGGGAVAYIGPARLLSLVIPPSQQEAPHSEAHEGTEKQIPDTGERKTFLMEDHIVNLVSGDGPPTRFVRVRVALIYNPAALPVGTLDASKAQIRDAFHGFLSQLTERDLEGSYGLAMIREELLRRSRAVTGSNAVQEVLITDLVIQ